jgi:hypothetical protein
LAYIGTKPTIGNFQICDAISVVNGQAAYTMQVGSVNVSPQSANHMIVSLNGTIQKPNSSFTVSGSTITFASNLATGDVIDFIQILGDVLDLGVPSDSTVSLAKLTATGTKDATTFLRGDNTFATPTDNGKVLQVVSANDSTTRTTTSTSFVDIGTLSVSITPSSTNNKVLIIFGTGAQVSSAGDVGYFTLDRDGTNIAPTTTNGFRNIQFGSSNSSTNLVSINYLDSPSSTSAITYKGQFRSNTGSNTVVANFNATTGTITVMEISA